MKLNFTILALALSLSVPAHAHRLDEYLQATLLSIDHGQLHASMRLIPGVAVFPQVRAAIDLNRDGRLSPTEQRAYADRILHDLSFTADGHSICPHIVSLQFPALVDMQAGTGEIHIELAADLPAGPATRNLIFENHHQPARSVYLVNCLSPQDPAIHIAAQTRNANQSFYRLDYVQTSIPAPAPPVLTRLLTAFAAFPEMFRLGLHHIAEGTDHLLFLLTLLLPAPLLASRRAWSTRANLHHSVMQILRVVTAFTIGHSFTLALAAFQIVHVPSRPIEVLIALSILISAIHALRPLFPGREALIAAFFGLIHGLAFATTLGQLGLTWTQRLTSLLGFNLGIEVMQLTVVAATLPSLLLLSRTYAYSLFRISSALFAALASLGWLADRLFSLPNPMDPFVLSLAHHALLLAALLFLLSLSALAHQLLPYRNGFTTRTAP